MGLLLTALDWLHGQRQLPSDEALALWQARALSAEQALSLQRRHGGQLVELNERLARHVAGRAS